MSPRDVLFVLALLTAATVPGTAGGIGNATGASASPVEFHALVPNPVADGDAGEAVILRVDGSRSLSNWSLADDDRRVALPNVTVSGRVVLTSAPNRSAVTGGTVVGLDSAPALANGGERLVLRRGNRTVDTVRYRDAPEGEVGRVTAAGIEWQPLGATSFPVVRGGAGTVEAFVLPDGAGVPVRTLAAADRRILLAGYTLGSRRVVERLRRAASRDVDVRVLVDGDPVGGLPRRQARMLDRLDDGNVSVRVLSGERARYDFHHAKYAVVDSRALVTTENWKPAGTGGRSSRGWGVVVGQRAAVDQLAATFRADWRARAAHRWRAFRRGRTFEPARAPPANESYPARLAPRRVRTRGVRVLVAPDNAERELLRLLDGARESIRIQQVSIGSRRQPFLRATLRAARRGVSVRILLSRAWYVREDNEELVRWLRARAEAEDLPVEIRLARPRGRYEKVHAKGVLVDGEHVVLGSLNWNNNSARENREVAVILSGPAVADYYGRAFRADWQGGRWLLPVGLVASVALAGLLAVLAGRRIEFESCENGNRG